MTFYNLILLNATVSCHEHVISGIYWSRETQTQKITVNHYILQHMRTQSKHLRAMYIINHVAGVYKNTPIKFKSRLELQYNHNLFNLCLPSAVFIAQRLVTELSKQLITNK